MSGLDWAGLMRVGLHDLRLLPSQFWALTPAELQVMLGVAKAVMPMGRGRLEELHAAFPDIAKDTEDG